MDPLKVKKTNKEMLRIWTSKKPKNNVRDMAPLKVKKTTNKTCTRNGEPKKASKTNVQDIVLKSNKKQCSGYASQKSKKQCSGYRFPKRQNNIYVQDIGLVLQYSNVTI